MKALVPRLWMTVATRCSHCLALLAPLTWIWLLLVPLAHADGGAPNLAYVAGAGSNGSDLAVIDIGQRTLTRRINVGGTPTGVVLNADGHYAYVTEALSGVLAVVDASEGRVVSTIKIGPSPGALAIDFNRQHPLLYVTESGSDRLAIVDPTATKVLAQIPVGLHPTSVSIASSASGIASPDDNEVYVASPDAGEVTVVSAVEQTVIASIPVPGGPQGVVVPSVGGVAYVTTRSGAVVALGLFNHRVLGTVFSAPGARFGTMDYDAATGQIYVPDAAHAVVDILAPVSSSAGAISLHEPARVLHLGGEPSAVAITFEGSYGFVTERAAGQLVVLDVGSHTVLGQVKVGGAPVAVVTGPYPPQIVGTAAVIVVGLVFAVLAALCGLVVWSTWRWEKQHPRRKSSRTAPGEAL